jgi:hypothetical protein
VEVQFGRGFSANCSVIVAGASANPTLNIRLLYEAQQVGELCCQTLGFRGIWAVC